MKESIEKTGEPCHWVEEDLCSACAMEIHDKDKIKPGMEL
jgi:hypothetical protein